MAGGGQVSLVHRLIGLHLAQDADVFVVLKQGVDRFEDALSRGDWVLGLADVRPFTGQPQDEVAAAACFLASDEAAYITGHVLSVNGGMYM